MSDKGESEITKAQLSRMMRFGGSFARAIGEAWFLADDDNRRRLQEAFPDLFEKYAKAEA